MSKEPNKQIEEVWGKEFDKKYPRGVVVLTGEGWGYGTTCEDVTSEIKDFISKLLKKAEERAYFKGYNLGLKDNPNTDNKQIEEVVEYLEKKLMNVCGRFEDASPPNDQGELLERWEKAKADFLEDIRQALSQGNRETPQVKETPKIISNN